MNIYIESMPHSLPFIYEPPQTALQICFEDDDLIAVDKPAGLLSVMGRLPEHQDSAYFRILAQYPQARVIHRLDMATSGILLFAKHRDAEVAMSKLFQARQVKKYYQALVQGKLEGQGCVDVPLIADWAQRPKQKVDWENGKPAQTKYSALHYLAEQDVSRMCLEPITGRSHQLRLHMAYLGHPITGDRYYHPNFAKSDLKRMALHAQSLQFLHPFHEQDTTIFAALPF